MNDTIEAVTSAAVSLALDAAAMRQQAIASNIANANTVGYVRQSVSFERQVADLSRTFHAQGALDRTALANVRLELEPAVHTGGAAGAVQLDVEVAQMAQNSAHYQALLKGLSRHYSLLSNAISEGKK